MAANVSYEGLQPFLFLILYLKLLDFFDSQAGDIDNEIRWLAFGFHFLGYFIFFGRAPFRTSFLAHVATRSKFFQTSENGVPILVQRV